MLGMRSVASVRSLCLNPQFISCADTVSTTVASLLQTKEITDSLTKAKVALHVLKTMKTMNTKLPSIKSCLIFKTLTTPRNFTKD